ASAGLVSIWVSAAVRARAPTGMLRKMKHTISTMPVPVISIGGTLNARMYETPMTGPGMANDSMLPDSTAALPRKLCRVRRYAERMPSAAVSGAASAASLIVVQNEFQAAPAHRMPWLVHSIARAFAEGLRAGAAVRPPR